ncbi:MAG: WYL domain-containing protein [Anaerolineaceae bacterium]|nr:WYL domain-containing protein [Anaerolineaceae bacterium]
MRADRLLAIVLYIQARGVVTAEELAKEMEVSERTIYRDIDALSFAGIPLYAEKGPGGGFSLLESYRTTLTALTQDEIQSLSLLNISEPFIELGLDEALRLGLMKVMAELSGSFQHVESQTRQRLYFDMGAKKRPRSLPFLDLIYEAIWEDHKLSLSYRFPYQNGIVVTRNACPFGLVVSSGEWYLVWEDQGKIDVYQVRDLVTVKVLKEEFSRPRKFDLASYWNQYLIKRKRKFPRYFVQLLISPDMIYEINQILGRSQIPVETNCRKNEKDWIQTELVFESFEEARRLLLGFGGAVKVIHPLALRLSIQDFASQIVSRYDGS